MSLHGEALFTRPREIGLGMAYSGLMAPTSWLLLHDAGNPELRSLTRILEATGLQLVVTAKPERKTRTPKKRASKSEAIAVAA